MSIFGFWVIIATIWGLWYRFDLMLKNPLHMQENTVLLHLKTLGFSEEAKALQNLRLLNETPFKDHIEELINLILTAPSPDDALNNIERVVSQFSIKSINAFIADMEKLKNLITICGASNLLSNTILTNLIYAEQLLFYKGLLLKEAALHR